MSLTLWLARVPTLGEPELDQMLALNGSSTRARLTRIHSPRRRIEFIRSRHLLRQLLSYQFKKSLKHWQIVEVENGPPDITNLPLGWYISGSHSRGLCGYALSDHPVGFDLEYRLQPRDFLGISREFFSAAEQRTLNSADPQQRNTLFYRFWSTKEAVFKAAYSSTPVSLTSIDYFDPGTWNLTELPLRQYSLSIASAQPLDRAKSFYSPRYNHTRSLGILNTPLDPVPAFESPAFHE